MIDTCIVAGNRLLRAHDCEGIPEEAKREMAKAARVKEALARQRMSRVANLGYCPELS